MRNGGALSDRDYGRRADNGVSSSSPERELNRVFVPLALGLARVDKYRRRAGISGGIGQDCTRAGHSRIDFPFRGKW